MDMLQFTDDEWQAAGSGCLDPEQQQHRYSRTAIMQNSDLEDNKWPRKP